MQILRHYPFSILTILAIWYLSFFTPPHTQLEEINNFDKLVHVCMYGGLSSIIWIYNPQIEMFARFKMKSSFHKTKRII